MAAGQTTIAIQDCLDRLGKLPEGEAKAAIVRELLASAATRLHVLCSSYLHRSYPRLARPPLGLSSDEILGAIVERMLKALREARPAGVRQFFALANQHMRWELNDLARRLDEHSAAVEVTESAVAAPESSHSRLSPNARRILQAIEALPDEEREVFDLVRIQGLQHNEVAELIGVSTKTVQRRLNRGLLLLSQALEDLRVDVRAEDRSADAF